jgi:uncharacterized protein YecE (DUF72 family)
MARSVKKVKKAPRDTSPRAKPASSGTRFFVGTSGYSYKEWKGGFYPARLPARDMLNYYAQQFSTVEINNTFRRMPKPGVMAAWAEQVPETFHFVLKAPQRITHFKRLKDVEEPVREFLEGATELKDRPWRMLFQLPPNFKKDVERLAGLLKLLKGQGEFALEFRHESWHDDEVYACLRKYGGALCIADAEDLPSPKLVSTARWGYVRLRRKAYTKAQLRKWLARLREQPWDDVYVFFKHEDTGTGPELARQFLKLAGQ